MRINLSKADQIQFNKLLETKEYNIVTADLLNDLCCIRDKNLEQFFHKDKWNIYNNNKLMSWAIYLLNIDYSLKQNKSFFTDYLSSSFVLQNNEEYEKNPYKSQIKPAKIKENQYEFKYEEYPAFSFFPLSDIEVDETNYYKEKTKVGLFEKAYNFLTLFKNGEIWMCITPNEMNTMESAISNSFGNVAVLGLGLGYYAYMVSNKDNVKSVTIYENDTTIINLFTTYILPQFPHKEKINIINGNALEYFNDINGKDYAFCDLWHDANDGLPLYINLKNNIKIKADYWIEESLIALYRRCLITVMEEALKNYHDKNYKYSSNELDKIINDIYFKTKNVNLYSYDEVHKYCSKENILKLITK